MKKRSNAFILRDVLDLLGMILPIVFCIVLKILTTPYEEGIVITGARIFARIPAPISELLITEAQVNSWAVVIAVFFLCRFLTHGLSVRRPTARQHLAEMAVEACEKLVRGNMGDYFANYAPFIAAMMALSAFSSLLSLFGLFAPTSDLNVVGGWALAVFFLITYYKMKCGPVSYLKSFTQPLALMTPLNVISEFATPVSMAFRHYGNIISGSVISVLVGTGLAGLSHMILGWLPGAIGEFPLFRIGIPAVLSVYFDVFSGLLQAFIFAMLTMLYVSGAFPLEEFLARRDKKKKHPPLHAQQ